MDNGASSYRRFLEGDEGAFSEILDLYRDNLIFFINRIVHNLHAAEDLAADCFVELLIHPKRYNFQYSLKTYLFTIAHHKTVNYIRRNKRCQPMSTEELEENATPMVQETPVVQQTPVEEMPVGTPQASLLPSGPKYTAPSVVPPGTNSKPLPLDEAFAQNLSEYAMPDQIAVLLDGSTQWIRNATTIGQICDWVMQGDFRENPQINGERPKADGYTIQFFYGEDIVTCYLAEDMLFKMEEGAWLETDPAYVAALMGILEED